MFQWLFDEAQMRADSVGAPVTPQQWDYIHEMGGALRSSLDNVTAVFAPSCIGHSVLTKRDWLNIKIDDISLAEALRCWERSTRKRRNSNDPQKQRKTNRRKNQHILLASNDLNQPNNANRNQTVALHRERHKLSKVERQRQRQNLSKEEREQRRQNRIRRKQQKKMLADKTGIALQPSNKNTKKNNRNRSTDKQLQNKSRKDEKIGDNHNQNLNINNRKKRRNRNNENGRNTTHRKKFAEPERCSLRLLERCSWPQCNHSCPALTNPLTGEEMRFLELLSSFGLDIEAVATALGVDMQTLNNMDHAELVNLLTQQVS